MRDTAEVPATGERVDAAVRSDCGSRGAGYYFSVWIDYTRVMEQPGGDDSASYCPSCGSAVDGQRYCGSCGHELSQPVGPSEREFERFRARVSEHVADGWDIEYDAGDEVTLVDRGYGSVAVHAVLLFTTGGLGNLLYGWYHYEHGARRKLIRASGSDIDSQSETGLESGPGPADADERSLSRYAGGLGLFVLAVAVLTSVGLSAVGLATAISLLLIGVLVLPSTRRRIENRYPPTTFGPTTSVDEQYVTGGDTPCAVCLDRVDSGVKREYKQSYVVAGLPLYTIERGENWYCESCWKKTTAGGAPTDSLDAELAAMDITADTGTDHPGVAGDGTSGDDPGVSGGGSSERRSGRETNGGEERAISKDESARD